MESIALLSQLPVPQLEPVAQLAPYLSGLDTHEAVEGFRQLADLVLAEEEQSERSSPSFLSSSPASAFTWSPWASECMGSGRPASTGSQWLSSGVNSPAPSSNWCSSFSSGPASVASSCDSLDTNSRCSQVGDRRRKNATAAERYRRKLKKRRCGLEKVLDEEEARNARLRRQIEDKLALYREFADLLARNLRPDDLELALLGSRSLAYVIESVRPGAGVGVELMSHLERFRNILRDQQYQQQEVQLQPDVASFVPICVSAPGTNLDSGLVYNFFSDSYVPEPRQVTTAYGSTN